jgi:hypothetical protein
VAVAVAVAAEAAHPGRVAGARLAHRRVGVVGPPVRVRRLHVAARPSAD